MGGGVGTGGMRGRRRSSLDDSDNGGDRDRAFGGGRAGGCADPFAPPGDDWRAAAAARAFEREAEARKSARSQGKSSFSASSDEEEEEEGVEEKEGAADEVAMMTAAAIDHATSLTQTETFAREHRYKSNTTLVSGAVAARGPMTTDNASKGSREQCRRAVEMAPACAHYVRNCHVVSPCCGATFACRICHDECPVLPAALPKDQREEWPTYATTATPGNYDIDNGPSHGGGGVGGGGGGGGGRKYTRVLRTSSMPTNFSNSMGSLEHHKLPRFEIAEVICRECFTKQSSKT